MPSIPNLAAGFKLLKEVDLNAVRRKSEEQFHLAVIGSAGAGKSTLISRLEQGPGIQKPQLFKIVSEHQSDQDLFIQPHTVILLVLDNSKKEEVPENILQKVKGNSVPLIICHNKTDLQPEVLPSFDGRLQGLRVEEVAVSALNKVSIDELLVPAMLDIYRDHEISLARNLPLFRKTVCSKLIDDTCFVNAAYSLTSGIAGINILLTVPLNAADMVVLTKNQALMAYKIALAFDLPSDWRQTIPKLTTVVGTGFLWRTIARQLVGLIPVVGVVPKVAVAYAGTYAIGQAIYRWCASNEKINIRSLKNLYSRALVRGREVARSMVARRGLAEQS